MDAATPDTSGNHHPDARRREIAVVALLVVVCDLTIYRGAGYTGIAGFLALAPLLLTLGAPQVRGRWSIAILGAMLMLLALRLAWCGSVLQVTLGLALLIAFAMSLAGLRPYVVETAVYGAQAIVAGFPALRRYVQLATRRSPPAGRVAWANLFLPTIALAIFGTIFVLANPDLTTWFGKGLQQFFTNIHDVLTRFAPLPSEILFWCVVAWIAAGLLRPLVSARLTSESHVAGKAGVEPPFKPTRAPLYAAFRNTLLAVIVLFAAYLAFEFLTLWRREFPPGFYYSGYAHEGAAWLTFALALATAMLSLAFRGQVLNDPRLSHLQRLAWFWSMENLVLAVAVYHRLFIYVGFNGMTRMRMVGLFGISAVVAGFLVVLWKIAHNRDFLWLLRRHLWTVAIAIYLFALTPVDAIVHRYNVGQILQGRSAPSVQISVHPIDAQGLLQLPPLLECQDATIREGVRALLDQHRERLESLTQANQQQGWTTFQFAEHLARERLQESLRSSRAYQDRKIRQAALDRFHKYAYQWY